MIHATVCFGVRYPRHRDCACTVFELLSRAVVFVGVIVVILVFSCTSQYHDDTRVVQHHVSAFVPPTDRRTTATRRTRRGTSMTPTAATSSTKAALPAELVPAVVPLPAPVCANIPGTWAYDTMARRLDSEIFQRTYEENKGVWDTDPDFAPILARFHQFRQQFRTAAVVATTPLPYPSAQYVRNNKIQNSATEDYQARVKERNEWIDILQPYIGGNEDEDEDGPATNQPSNATATATWLSAPWMITEFYAYRVLVIDVIRYWDANTPGYQYDPFLQSKLDGVRSSVTSAENVLTKINTVIRQLQEQGIPNSDNANGDAKDNSNSNKNQNKNHTTIIRDGLQLALSIALWGNKMDLSLWPADINDSHRDIFSAIMEQANTEGLLHDDSDVVIDHCVKLLHASSSSDGKGGGGNIHIIVDNAGFELITDLILGQYLIESGIAKTVTYQLKSHPTFVSDALEKDLLQHIEYYRILEETTSYPNCIAAGTKWKHYIKTGQFICNEDNFWNQGYPMWKITEPIRSVLYEQCDLAIVKGDANYRRLLGDLEWDYADHTFQSVCGSYFPCPIVALRTLKAEIGCGIVQTEIQRAQQLDPNWQTNGRFGVIHFGTGYQHSQPKPPQE